jgi:hypothetical protein
VLNENFVGARSVLDSISLRSVKVVLGALVALTSARSGNFELYKDGVGPIAVSVTVIVKSGKALVVASARNGSPWPLTDLKLCVSGSSKKSTGCVFNLWITQTLGADETVAWSHVVVPSQRGIESPRPNITGIRWYIPQLVPVRALYVEPLQGNSGEENRDRLVSLLVNHLRFQVVEREDLADAVLKGRAELADEGTLVRSEGTEQSHGSAGRVFGTVLTGTKSHQNSSQFTKAIVSEKLLLRLTLRSGETVWAWDDTKPCHQTKARCAVEELVNVSNR